jgi:hypothetical protein
MRIVGIITLIVSLILLLLTCIAWGFLAQITETGFNPVPLLLAITVLTVAGILTAAMMMLGVFDDV